jgi:hypothetical protein
MQFENMRSTTRAKICTFLAVTFDPDDNFSLKKVFVNSHLTGAWFLCCAELRIDPSLNAALIQNLHVFGRNF